MKHYHKFEECVYWRYGVFLSLPPSKKEDSHTFILVELDELIINLRVRSASASVASGVLLVLTGYFFFVKNKTNQIKSKNSFSLSLQQVSFKILFMNGTISLFLPIPFLFLVLIVCVPLWISLIRGRGRGLGSQESWKSWGEVRRLGQ